MPQNTAIMSPPSRPWYRRVAASPRYVVLAVAGLLIVGGAGVFGADQLLSDDPATPSNERPAGGGGDTNDQGDNNDGGGDQKRAVVPGNVTVAVLNGTTVPNLAKQVGDRVESHGFVLGTVANSADQEQQRAESVVLYAPRHQREARAVNKRLGIAQREPIDPASQELAGDATVVVIAGADLAQ
jgi:LytR cell envelope-related transcriptional attenuator